MILLPSEWTILTPHFQKPTGAKFFWGLFPFQHQYHLVYHQLKYFHIFVLSRTEPVTQNFCTIPCTVYAGLFLTNLNSTTVCLILALQITAHEHSLFNRKHLSHALTIHTRRNTNGQLHYGPAFIRKQKAPVHSLWLSKVSFPYAQGLD